MPTYDYQCKACGHEFELFQQMSDPLKRKCPKCGKPKLERLIGIGAGVLFKGGGFYETDYRSDSYTKAAEAEKKAAEPKSEAAKSDATPKDKPATETKAAEKPAVESGALSTASKTKIGKSSAAARKPKRASRGK